MKTPSRRLSKVDRTVCPACGSGELLTRPLAVRLSVRCDSCEQSFDASLARTIEQIAALTDAVGRHACECGHPEMRRLPDGVFHCPACRSEVTPAG